MSNEAESCRRLVEVNRNLWNDELKAALQKTDNASEINRLNAWVCAANYILMQMSETSIRDKTYAWSRGRYYVLQNGEWVDQASVSLWRRVLNKLAYWIRSL